MALLVTNRRAFIFSLFGLTLLGAMLFFSDIAAHAQPAPTTQRTPRTETEKVGFAFYRLAKRPPPFENWIKSSDNYLLAGPVDKQNILHTELQRLARANQEYTLDDDLIHIKTRVEIRATEKLDKKAKDSGLIHRPISINMKEIKHGYFPVQLGTLWIALIPNDLESFALFSPAPEDYERLRDKLSLSGLPRPARMELRLRPRRVDLRSPQSLDGVEAWPMLAEIASLSLWRGKEMVWEYRAEWYRNRTQKELLDLYER